MAAQMPATKPIKTYERGLTLPAIFTASIMSWVAENWVGQRRGREKPGGEEQSLWGGGRAAVVTVSVCHRRRHPFATIDEPNKRATTLNQGGCDTLSVCVRGLKWVRSSRTTAHLLGKN
jgi:hypothetical protein